ncbi:MAG: MFS transporter [Anaerolineae bacterium]|nr:MFS transporter [Anaerolineae bacterium]
MLKTFQALSNHNYRLFWSGQIVSLVGTWMQSTAQAWLVLQLTGSPLAMGVVTALQTLPILLFTLVGGVFADRVAKRRFLILTQSISALQALALAVLVGTGHVQLWHVYTLAFLLGLINAFDNPTRQAFVVELVGRKDLPNAVALNSSLFNAARIIGPAVGGLTIAALGVAGAFYANAISFVPAIVSLALMRSDLFYSIPQPNKGSVVKQVSEGLGYVRHTTTAMIVVLMMGILGTFGYNFSVTLPLIAEFVFKTSAVGFGGVTAFMGVGSLLGGLVLAYRSQATYRLLLGSSALFAVFLFALALSRSYALTLALLIPLGMASIAYTATSNTLLQMNTPDHLRGRVMSIYFLLFAGSTPIGGFITGWLASRIGVPETIALEAVICFVGVIYGMRYYQRHQGEIPVEQQAGSRRPALRA